MNNKLNDKDLEKVSGGFSSHSDQKVINPVVGKKYLIYDNRATGSVRPWRSGTLIRIGASHDGYCMYIFNEESRGGLGESHLGGVYSINSKYAEIYELTNQ